MIEIAVPGDFGTTVQKVHLKPPFEFFFFTRPHVVSAVTMDTPTAPQLTVTLRDSHV